MGATVKIGGYLGWWAGKEQEPLSCELNRRVRFYSERVCLVWNQTLSESGVALEIFLK